ncbi:hypothetical protein Hanom_Chr08g00744541 [Helianthus anomalus]
MYTEACEAVKVLEARLKKAEITISDQGKIVEAKTQHYEDKLKKVTQDAEVKLAAAQVNHEQAMTSFRDGLKNSAIVSLVQARIKMAYKAKDAGFEYPTWPVDSLVAKLKDVGGSHVPHPTKSGIGEPLKAVDAAVETGEKTEAREDGGDVGAEKAGEDVVVCGQRSGR